MNRYSALARENQLLQPVGSTTESTRIAFIGRFSTNC